jgi:hypothetical protein
MKDKIHTIKSTASELLARAGHQTGIDIIDSEIKVGLTILLDSLNTEANLSEAGAIAMEQRLLRILCNRLRMQRDFQNHPEIEEQVIKQPIFLTGGPRTGSTKLQKLLAASGDFKYLPFWQVHTLATVTGDRKEDPAPRIQESKEYIDWLNEAAPKVQHIHGYGVHEPEEETLLYEHGLFGFFIVCVAFVPTFAQWYMAQSEEKLMGFFHQTLKYIQWQFHDGDDRPWLLKSPAHQGQEALLAKVFGDVRIITTNRDPMLTMPSAVSLVCAYHEAYTDENRREILGPMIMGGQAQRMLEFIRQQEQGPAPEVLEISYPDLTQNVDKMIDDIYDHIGMTLKSESQAAMLTWNKDNQPPEKRAHKPNLREFGLTEDMIKETYSPYIKRSQHLF